MLKIKKIILLSILTFLTLSFFTNFTYALLGAKWFTDSLNVQVGDKVKIDLFIDPEEDRPVVTISNSLNYNKDKLKFINAYPPEGWISISKQPHSITDEANGFLRRTAGLPNGASKNTKYMTFEFEAIMPGQADLSIEDGLVLDQDNNDLGFQKKKMQINITEKAKVAEIVEGTKATTSNNVLDGLTKIDEPKISTLSLDVHGKTAIHKGEDYVLTFFKDTGVNKDKDATISIYIVDSEGKNVYTKQITHGKYGPDTVDIIIPGIVFDIGDYSIQMRTKYEGTSDVVLSEKEIGVLESDKDWFDRNRNELLTIFGILVVLSILYHIHHDHVIFRRLRARANRN